MGASEFYTMAPGITAQEAFNRAQEDARYVRGHSGYTGTVAEKRSFIVVEPKDGEDPNDCANRMLQEDDPRIDDKWGPAGCVKLPNNQWLFFGWASS